MEIISLNTFVKDKISATLSSLWETFYPLKANGTLNTSWQLNYDVSGFFVQVNNASANLDFWVDLSYSDGTNNYDIITDLRFHKDRGVPELSSVVYVPLEIPRGYSIKGRAIALETIDVNLYLIPKTFINSLSCSVYKRYDVQVNSSGYSSIVEVINPVPFHVKYMIVALSLANIDTLPSSQFIWWKLYIGALGSEQELFSLGEGIETGVDGGSDEIIPNTWGFPIHIPKGERLAISHDTSDIGETIFDYSIYLFG